MPTAGTDLDNSRFLSLPTTLHVCMLSARGIPSPSFDEDASFNPPYEVAADLDAVLDATAELHDLLLEPLGLLHRQGSHNNLLCLQAIAEFKIADIVPLHGQVSFVDIVSQTPMTSEITAPLLRHAMTMRVFREPEPGMVAHTAASRLFSVCTQGYALSNISSETSYEIFAKDAERASHFARGMQVFAQGPQFDLSYVTNYYDWVSLSQAQVVDIGGSQGHLSLALARQFNNLSMIVQDMEKVVENVTAPEELQERVRFMAHNLLAPQPREAKTMTQETLMPEPGTVAMWKEKNLRYKGTVTEFKYLLHKSDPAFVLQKIIEPAGSALGMLEFVWAGGTT
ncbi:S-adenosyl-L-methionine-dependent methyltransferase [Hypoxylon sp. NC1633]|nr:S-adenosyl-L-methionine-dependent methyltransferase [Hypoxylon sp. NC1633]